MFEKGDIILNFRRYKIYKYDPNIEWQRKEQSYCRLASLSELRKIQRAFRKQKTDIISFSDINFRSPFARRWYYRDNIKETIKLNRFQLWHFHKILKTQNFDSYSDVIDFLLKEYFKQKKQYCSSDNELKNLKQIFVSFLDELELLIKKIRRYLT